MADGALLLQDLGSTNGTFVNGDQLRRPYVLRPGDVVRVGATELELVEQDWGAEASSPPPAGVAGWSGGAAVGGNVHADRGSIGAIGRVDGNVDVRHSEFHEHDASGLAFIARTRGAARFFIVLGVFVSLIGFGLFGYPIVRELVERTDIGSGPAELTQAIRDCKDRFPLFSEERSRCIEDAQNNQFAQSTEEFAPDLTPWLPLGAALMLAGSAIYIAGIFMIRRAD